MRTKRPRSSAANGGRPRTKRASQRYGGQPAREALRVDAPYYLLTQVRSAAGANPKHRSTLAGLALGRIGKRVLVPEHRQLVSAIAEVAPYVVVTPVEDPDRVPRTRLLGASSRMRKAGISRQRSRPGRDVYTGGTWPKGQTDMPASAKLTEAVKDTLGLVRPELTDAQLKAAAEVIAEDVSPDAVTVNRKDVSRTREAVEEAIARTAGEGKNKPKSSHD